MCNLTNITVEYDKGSAYRDEFFENVYLVLRNVQAAVTVFVNLLTILIIVRYKQLHTSSNVLIVSLAAADLITGLSTPFALSDVIIVRTEGDATLWIRLCLLSTWLTVLSSSGNFVHVLAISVDRFLAIKTPVVYRHSVTRRRMVVAVLLVWTVIVLSTTLYISLGRNPQLGLGLVCIWKTVFNEMVFKYLLLAPYVLTSLISTCLYISVGYMVKRRTSQIGSVTSSKNIKLLQQRKLTKMMALVVVTYYALYLPAAMENIVQYDVIVKFYISKVLLLLFFTNALINPFIYSGQSTEFNTAYRKILRLKTNN